MDLVSHSVLIMSAVAITLGLLYLRFWISQRDRVDFLLFSACCFSAGVYAWLETAIMKTESIEEMSRFVWWAQLPAGLAIISVASFLFRYLKAGDKRLYIGFVVTRILGIVLNFFLTPSISYRRITSINYTTFLGEKLSIPVGEASPFSLVNQFALIILLAFCVDTAINVWSGGERRKAVIFSGGVACFVVYAIIMSVSLIWLPTGLPMLASPAIMLVVLAMGYELNSDLHSSAILAKTLTLREAELRESIKQLNLSADAADVGVWIRSADGELIWASDKWYELFGLDPRKRITLNEYLNVLDPNDREPMRRTLTVNPNANDEYEIEYEITLSNGDMRWIRGRGRTDRTSDGQLILRGASVDVTKLKLAQESAHDLSRKLMNAQEKERARLARELHDDLSQTLALLSIQLHSIASNHLDAETLSSRLGNITYQIDRLSSDVHRISHELHPAKLEQLGLVSALRGFCREVSSTHGLKVDFHDQNIPRELANDVSLCLYRVAQESLQNVVKHSGASNVTVEMSCFDRQIRLSIADNGSGFDVATEDEQEGLGLTSMKERLRAVDGSVTIDSAVGAGTKVDVTVPIARTSKISSVPPVAGGRIMSGSFALEPGKFRRNDKL